MNPQIFTINCDCCGQRHNIQIDRDKLTTAQLAGKEPALEDFICPNVALMYRVMSYVLDTRANILKSLPEEAQRATLEGFKAEWGISNFELKIERFNKLNPVLLGIPEEYYILLQAIISSYCCGYFYPAMTSAGALGERILNRLMLKTRDYFKSSPNYKKIYRKKSSDKWDLLISLLKEWRIISDDVADSFARLEKYRNDSIHYNESYDFESNSHEAVKLLVEIINQQFNYMNRRDLFWVFNCPGEIWVRSNVLSNPFVIEFVLPHCLQLTPFCEPTATPPIRGKNAPLKPLSDEEFIHIRNSRKK